MPAPAQPPSRYHDSLGRPFLLDRHARIGVKGKAVEYGPLEEITPVKRIYTLADEPVFEAVLDALVANAGARKLVRDAYRSARAERTLDAEKAGDLIAEAVALMRAIPAEQARAIVATRLERTLKPGEGGSKVSGRAGGRDGTAAQRKTTVRRMRRHRLGG